ASQASPFLNDGTETGGFGAHASEDSCVGPVVFFIESTHDVQASVASSIEAPRGPLRVQAEDSPITDDHMVEVELTPAPKVMQHGPLVVRQLGQLGSCELLAPGTLLP